MNRILYLGLFLLAIIPFRAESHPSVLESIFDEKLQAFVDRVNAKDAEAVYRQSSQWFRKKIPFTAFQKNWPKGFKINEATIVHFSQRSRAAYTIVRFEYVQATESGKGFAVIFWDLEPDGWRFNNVSIGPWILPADMPRALEDGFFNSETTAGK